MNLIRLALAIGPALVLAAPALAAPPKINEISPFGVQRGVAAEVTVNGSDLRGNLRLVAPFGFRVASPPPGNSDASNGKLTLTIDGETPVGVYPVRVQTDEGLSNPFLFAVGQLPQVNEKEDNSTFETAQVFTAPAVIEGRAAGNDVDYYRFAGKKGQKIVVDAQCARVGSGVDPSIRLTTVSRVFVASAEDSPGLLTDARLFAVLPEDTDYVIELSDSRYQGGGRPIYRLLVGEVPAAEEVYPIGGRSGETVGLELRGGTIDGLKIAAARVERSGGVPLARVRASGVPGGLDLESLPQLIVDNLTEVRESIDPAEGPARAAVPVVLNGRIDPAGDEDRFVLSVTPGQKLHFAVEAAERGSALDGVLQVFDAKGGQLAQADDTTTAPATKAANAKNTGTVSPDPTLDFTVPAGQTELTLGLRDLASRGGIGFPYRIVVSTTVPGFKVALNESQASVPKGGTVAVGATVARKGYNGPIVLRVVNPPAGLSARPGTIADGQTLGVFTVSAAADAVFGVVNLDVVAEAQGVDGRTVVKVGKTTVFAQQETLQTNTMTQDGLTVAPALAQGLSLDTPSEPIEVAHGSGVPIPVKVAREKDADGALAVTLLNPTPGVTGSPATIGAKDVGVTVTLNTTTDIPLGPMTVALVAKGKVAGVDRSIDAPALTINVIRPASVELASAAIEIKAGATAEFKGKVLRKGAFKEPVTVKVNGLPAGLKADPVTVPADASEFTVKLSAEAKAAPATAPASVALAFQVNKKDYPAPTAALSVKVLPPK